MKTLRILVLTWLLCIAVPAAPGDVDPTFGVNGGYFASNFENLSLDERPRDVALQADGKIVAVGARATATAGITEFYVARFNADGTPDAGFSGDGFFAYSPSGPGFAAEAVAVQSDGKIVAAGGLGEGTTTAYVMRLNSDGTLDSSFDGDGVAVVSSTGYALAVAIQTDGKIVFTTAYNGGALPTGYLSFLVRLNSNGSLDTSFDTDGRRLISDSSNPTVYRARGLAVQSDGKYVVAGQTSPNLSHGFSVFRFLATGVADAAFNGGGRILPSGTANSVLVQPDGKIVAGGGLVVTTGEEPAMVRLNSDGSFDNGFDGDGILTKELVVNNQDYPVSDVVVQSDGKLVAIVAGDTTFPDFITEDHFVFRVNSDGATDNSFDSNGIAKSQWCENGRGLALQPDGKIVAIGARDRANDGISNRAACLQRFNSNGSVDYGLNASAASGKAVIANGKLTEINAVAALPNGKIIVAGSNDDNGIVGGVVMRLNADGTLDTSFMDEGLYVRDDNTTTSDTVFHDVRVLPDGGFIVAGGSELNGGTLVKFTSAGLRDTTFSGDGVVTTGVALRFYGVAVQPDGKFIACGSSGTATRTGRIVRFSTVGAFEASTANSMGAPGQNNEMLDCALQSDGKIVVAGFGRSSALNSDFVSISRHTATLAVDTTFGSSGIVTSDLSPTVDDRATEVAIQPDDKIVVSSTGLNGGGDRDFAVARFDPNGTPDINLAESFGNNGVTLIDFIVGNPNDEANAILLQSDGQLLVAGSSDAGAGRRFGLAKLNAGGTLALGFGTLGRVVMQFPGNDSVGQAMGFYLNDRVIVAGKAWNGTDFDFALARFQNELLPTSAGVGISGRVVTAKGHGIANVEVTATDMKGNVRRVRTDRLGAYWFDELTAGETYVLSIGAKRYRFAEPSRVVTLNDSVFDEDFVASPR